MEKRRKCCLPSFSPVSTLFPTLSQMNPITRGIFYCLLSTNMVNKTLYRILQSAKRFTTQSRLLTTLKKTLSKIIVEKGENAGNQHFLLFPQCFLPIQKKLILIFKLSAKFHDFNLDQSKNLLCRKDLGAIQSNNPCNYNKL